MIRATWYVKGKELSDHDISTRFYNLKQILKDFVGSKVAPGGLDFFEIKDSKPIFKKRKNTNFKLALNSMFSMNGSDLPSQLAFFGSNITLFKWLSRRVRRKFKIHTGYFIRKKRGRVTIFLINHHFFLNYLNDKELNANPGNIVLEIRLSSSNKSIQSLIRTLF